MVGASGGAVSMMNEDGVSLSRNTGMQTSQVQVIKCKACGEILSHEHNYHYTAEELAGFEAQRRKSDDKYLWVVFVLFCLLVGFFLFGAIIGAVRGTPASVVLFLLVMALFLAGVGWCCRPSSFK